MQIYNCHMHIFTLDHVPENFLPCKLGTLMKIPFIQAPLRFLLINLNPFSNRDLFQRYADFIKISLNRSKEEIFKEVRAHYPLTKEVFRD